MRRAVDLTLIASLVLSVALNVMFVRREAIRRRPPTPLPGVGTLLPPLDVKTLDGTNVALGYAAGQKPRLIYAFSPKCSWCDRNLNNIEALSRSLEERYEVVAVAVKKDDLGDYLKRVRMDVPIFTDPSDATRRAYGFGVTPQTLVVSATGEVLFHWQSAYGRRLVGAIESGLGVTVPGVPELP